MGTTEYVVRRALQLVPLLFLLTVIVFGMMHLAPGDPAATVAGPRATDADIQRISEAMGLNEPILKQYGIWLKRMLTGDFGESFIARRPVGDMILERLWPTVLLMGTANVVSLLIAIPLGLVAAVKQYSLSDTVLTTITFVGISVPSFWFGLLLMWLFGVKLQLLPLTGMSTPGEPTTVIDILRHLIMPVTVIAFVYTAFWMRFVRSGVLEVLTQDYVLFARSKGLPPGRLYTKHVLRNGLMPLITLIGLSVPELITGSVVVEAVFSWPGLGLLAYSAANSRDFSVVMALVVLASVAVVVGNLIADLAYRWVDPRIRLT